MKTSSEPWRDHSISPPTFLVVDDDRTLQPLVEFVIQHAHPRAVMFWATSMRDAFIRLEADEWFDVVIADVYLGTTPGGLELWRKFRSRSIPFVLTSGMTAEKFLSLIEPGETPPAFLPKLADPQEWIETLKVVLQYPDFY